MKASPPAPAEQHDTFFRANCAAAPPRQRASAYPPGSVKQDSVSLSVAVRTAISDPDNIRTGAS